MRVRPERLVLACCRKWDHLSEAATLCLLQGFAQGDRRVVWHEGLWS